ncbi:Ubiquitin carboxyl-terminal hydrolase 36 [Nowakowskiella sp. JEL0078]|nr:Ubiquitin carboxyl-terminal hydrolase 36 [Nowakowskiella sp. JEL0078]
MEHVHLASKSLDSIGRLKAIIGGIRINGKFDEMFTDERKARLRINLRRLNEAKLVEMARLLSEIVQFIILFDSNPEKKNLPLDVSESIGEILAIHFDQNFCQSFADAASTSELAQLPLCNLKSIGTTIVQKYENMEYLFSNLPDELDQACGEAVESELHVLMMDLRETTNCSEVSHLECKFRDLSESLNQIVSELRKFLNQPLRNVLGEVKKSMSDTSLQTFINQILPLSIEVQHLGTYLRFLHRCSASLSNFFKEKSDPNQIATVYIENIPDFELDNQEEFLKIDSMQDQNQLMHQAEQPIAYKQKYKIYSKKFSAKVPPGVINIGSTCYASAVIQCLLAQESTRQALLSERSNSSLTGSFRRLLDARSRNMDPSELLQKLQQIYYRYMRNKQEDAHEFLLDIVDNISELQKVLELKVRKRTECNECASLNEKQETQFNIHVNLPAKEHFESPLQLNDLLSEVSKFENVEGWVCEKCKNTGVSVHTEILTSPKVLVVTVLRFAYDMLGRISEKLKHSLIVPPTLYLSTVSGKIRYQLTSVCNHSGVSPYSGHYTTTALMPNSDEWYLFDDTFVRQSDPPSGNLSEESYLLFFTHAEDGPNSPMKEQLENENVNVLSTSFQSPLNDPKSLTGASKTLTLRKYHGDDAKKKFKVKVSISKMKTIDDLLEFGSQVLKMNTAAVAVLDSEFSLVSEIEILQNGLDGQEVYLLNQEQYEKILDE